MFNFTCTYPLQREPFGFLQTFIHLVGGKRTEKQTHWSMWTDILYYQYKISFHKIYGLPWNLWQTFMVPRSCDDFGDLLTSLSSGSRVVLIEMSTTIRWIAIKFAHLPIRMNCNNFDYPIHISSSTIIWSNFCQFAQYFGLWLNTL